MAAFGDASRVFFRYGVIPGVENRRAAMRDEVFAVNAVQMSGYDPCTITGFEMPKQYGLRQIIADTLGGIVMRALRTIPALEDFVRDSVQVCSETLMKSLGGGYLVATGGDDGPAHGVGTIAGRHCVRGGADLSKPTGNGGCRNTGETHV
jgi:hypothetical protein